MSRQHPDASVDVSGYAFGAILADRWLELQKSRQYHVKEWRDLGEIYFLRNTEIRLENISNTRIGVHHLERRVQRFSWV